MLRVCATTSRHSFIFAGPNDCVKATNDAKRETCDDITSDEVVLVTAVTSTIKDLDGNSTPRKLSR